MYQVLFYLKGQNCDIKKGFESREAAWKWVESIYDDIDWYEINEQ